MEVIIIGGGGFLGSQLAQKLLSRGTLTGPSGAPEPLREIQLFDAFYGRPVPESGAIRVTAVTGDISDRAAVAAAMGSDTATSIFHLTSMVSGECEERFDDALGVNLDGGRAGAGRRHRRAPAGGVCEQHRGLRRRRDGAR